jgi:hypothetical protein
VGNFLGNKSVQESKYLIGVKNWSSSSRLPGIPRLLSFIINNLQRSSKKVKLSVPCPPRVGRSVREPPQDGSEYKAIELIALRLRDAWVGEFYLRLQTMGSLNSGGIREKQWLPWVSTDAARP